MAGPWERFAQAPQPQGQPWAKFAQLQAPVQQPQAAPQPNPNATDNFSAGGVSMGVLDPIYGIGQAVPRALSAVTSLGGYAPNPVSRAYDKSAEQIDQSYKGMSEPYEKGRATPQDFDWGRLTGNVISPVNWLGAGSGPAMKGASLGKKLVAGMGLGAAYGATAPVSDTENYAENKATQMGLGAAAGTVAPLVVTHEEAVSYAVLRAVVNDSVVAERIELNACTVTPIASVNTKSPSVREVL